MLEIATVIKIFMLLNPLASIPVLAVAYTKKMDVKSIAVRAVILGYIVALAFVVSGALLFEIYGISVDSFRMGGGIIIFLLGLSMVKEKKTEEDVEQPDALISLIATPLLTGPATLSFLILNANEVGIVYVITNLSAAYLLVALVFLVLAFMIPNINIKIVRFVSRLLGLFLVALGIEMVTKGIRTILMVNV